MVEFNQISISKMARSFLRHIRVSSKNELKKHILKGIEEINAAPVLCSGGKNLILKFINVNILMNRYISGNFKYS